LIGIGTDGCRYQASLGVFCAGVARVDLAPPDRSADLVDTVVALDPSLPSQASTLTSDATTGIPLARSSTR
jgi:hypothetical protein